MHGSWPEKMLAEGIGTFALVFVGTGAIVVDRVSGGAIGHVGIALCFGLTVMTMIYAVGDISGAHFNPAVTVGFWSARRLPGRTVPVYLAAQLLGAILASAVLRALFPAELDLGATRPGENIVAAFVLEGILTFFLMFVILSVATGAKEKGIIAGIAVGSVVCFSAIFGGPISGASLNPARSLGPAIFSGALGTLWLYVLAPLLGALLAVGAWWGLGAGQRSQQILPAPPTGPAG
ncbi:MAG: aquaporin [Myxococcota bacterium]|nr:aquaporin [Myxococcota bacterium]